VRPLVIAWKELVQLRRDRLTLAMTVVLPLMQLLLFGYAINNDVRHIPTVIYDQDHTAASRDLGQSLQATGSFDLVGAVNGYDDITRAFLEGRARVAIVIPPRYSSNLVRGLPVTVQLVVDGVDPQTAGSATTVAGSLVSARSAELSIARLPTRGGPVIELEPTVWYNPDLRTAVFVVPGLVGVLLTMTMVMLTSMALARERERGTLEQLIVSPVRKLELIVGKILPYIAIGYLQMTLILFAARVVFDVPIVGSLLLFYVLAFAFIAANLAIGLFFSTLAKTQQQAMQMSFFFFLPNILLSGFMFPYEGMPRFAQIIGQALPLTHFMRIVRGVVLRGAGFSHLASELLALCVILAVLVLAASTRVSKKLV
jgi:ABC-2 type transport system permease protein